MNKLPNESLNEERPDALDCILLEDALIPSSGFAASVMEAIEEQASQPASIPFPWKLAMPGLAALLIVIVSALRLLAAGLHHGTTTVAVATGRFTAAELAESGAHVIFADLSDTPAVAEALLPRTG